MRELAHEIRYATRVLLRARGSTFALVIILGVGIGASTTIFSAVNGVLRRPLPYVDPDRLVALSESHRQLTERAAVSAANFVDWKELNRTFDALAAYRHWGFVLTGEGGPERVLGARVSANLFVLLGVHALYGRTFLPDDHRAATVVLLSEELWRRRFGGESSVIGRHLRLDDKSYTIVGIVPAGFELPSADLWVPLIFEPYALQQRGNRALSVIGRLNSATGLASAREDLQRVAQVLDERHPDSNKGWGIVATPLHQEITGSSRVPLLLLFAATGGLLLIACANLATLTLARTAVRRREMAVRAALGAGRFRIVRQLFVESSIMAVAAGTLALLITVIGTAQLAALGPAYLPRASSIRIDWFVLGFACLVTLLTGLAFAVVSAIGVFHVDLTTSMKAASPTPGARRSAIARVQLPDLLVAGQIALALLLLIGAGLLVRSILHVQAVDPGFSAERVLSMTVSLSSAKYPESGRRTAFFTELQRRLQGVPGIRATGLVSHLPLAGGALRSDFIIETQPTPSSAVTPTADLRNVDAGYFRTMGIRVVAGRPFAESDGVGRPPVVIVDQALVTHFLPNLDPLRQRVRLGTTIGADPAWRDIVGVVSSVRSASLEMPPRPTVFVPYSQNPWPAMTLVVQTVADPARLAGAIRAEIQAVDRDQPVYNVRTMDQVFGRAVAFRRFQTVLLAAFAVAASVLAVLGVYALLAYVVTQRVRELGIRVALGARPGQIRAFVMQKAITLVGAGVIAGGAAAIAGARLLTSLLFDVSPWDLATLAGSTLLLTTAGLVASYVPARRAATVEPVSALRGE
jgi:putative ABC transport system permease protein